MVRGICHQNSPVAHTAAASVRTMGVPMAPNAPYIFECESEATTNDPGTTYPPSIITWCPIPEPCRIESDPVLCREGGDGPVFLQIGFFVVLDVVIDGKDRLLRI